MKRTFASEDQRKDKLFAAWNQYFLEIDEKFDLITNGLSEFEDTYEGLATVSYVTEKAMNLHLESGKIVKYITINSKIKESCQPLDCFYILLGFKDNKWWPIDIVSIGTILDRNQVHLTVNPEKSRK